MRTNTDGNGAPKSLFQRATIHDPVYFGSFVAAILIASLLLFLIGPGSLASRRNFSGIIPGKIAERDITAGKDVVYVDKAATKLRLESEEQLVLPVFQIDSSISTQSMNQLRGFKDYFQELLNSGTPFESMQLMIQSRFPGIISRDTLYSLMKTPLKSQVFLYTETILEDVMYRGIFVIPSEGLDVYNPDYFNLKRLVNGKAEYEQLPRTSLTTKADLPRILAEEMTQRHLAPPLSGIVSDLVNAFAAENSFFDAAQSSLLLQKVRSKIEPVTRSVGKNELLVKKGEMVSTENYDRIIAIQKAISTSDAGLLLSGIGLLLVAAFFGYLVLHENNLPSTVSGRSAGSLIIWTSLLFYVAVMLAGRTSMNRTPLDGAYFIPASLFAGMIAALTSTHIGLFFSVLLALLTASASNLNAHLVLLVLLSGIAANLTTSTANTRIMLVKAAVMQASVQFFVTVILLLQNGLYLGDLLPTAFLQALNGFISGTLLLALLPVLEQLLNIPTRFRLMELSDINSPALKELLTVAPGTYTHSINVAHLAETAAEDVGADPLLARVGAYYHDIGKTDQPEYFVENQSGTNRHDDMNPRLSATVIRSHVKLGTEKARELGLPQAVVDIVAQHHGNSVIAWFYAKAKKDDPAVRIEDFSYPGVPPTSRESGIVMLADSVEAATRTLKKPTMSRLEEYIRQIIMEKMQNGQLDNCGLTLRDLDIINNSFARILAGHFHSRIEYPKQKEASR
jgi:putative nucleotidyltransferase with HDIG domain